MPSPKGVQFHEMGHVRGRVTAATQFSEFLQQSDFPDKSNYPAYKTNNMIIAYISYTKCTLNIVQMIQLSKINILPLDVA